MQIRAYVAWTSAQLYCVKQQWFKFATVFFSLSKSAISLIYEVLQKKNKTLYGGADARDLQSYKNQQIRGGTQKISFGGESTDGKSIQKQASNKGSV